MYSTDSIVSQSSMCDSFERNNTDHGFYNHCVTHNESGTGYNTFHNVGQYSTCDSGTLPYEEGHGEGDRKSSRREVLDYGTDQFAVKGTVYGNNDFTVATSSFYSRSESFKRKDECISDYVFTVSVFDILYRFHLCICYVAGTKEACQYIELIKYFKMC